LPKISAILQTGELPVGRIEAFSDGVMAIVVTILVLEMKVPDVHLASDVGGALAEKLIESIPKILSYVVSFLVLAVWWVAHHQLIHLLKKSDRGVLWLNSLFLMFLALIPWPTAIIGEYPMQRVSVMLYGGIGILTGASFFMLRWYITRKTSTLCHEIPQELRDRGLRRGLISPMIYAVSMALCFVHPAISLVGFALVPFFYFVPGVLDRHSRITVSN
jgi:uncharacterized membrane protein